MKRLRTLLVLGRVSNCPTVWSNCLAAWWLSGGGSWGRFGLLCGGTTLLYTGGMFLNDACDVAFDRQYRPERPVPSGQITRAAVSVLGSVLLLAAWLALLALGKGVAAFAGVLLGAIVVYDLAHKHTRSGPLLMSFCRVLVYLVAAAAAQGGLHFPVWWRALAMGAYVCGLSYLARGESTAPAGARVVRPFPAWPLDWLAGLILSPIGLAFLLDGASASVCLSAGGLGLWLLWCLPSRRISGLLAGIALVDWVAAAATVPEMGPVFVALFLLALTLQRLVPAT